MGVRLFIHDPLKEEQTFDLLEDKAHYLTHVMRLQEGDKIFLFNGMDGEFRATILSIKKRKVTLYLDAKTKDYKARPPLLLIFCPIKQDRLNFLIEKATELGVTHLKPVVSDFTQIQKINKDRLLKIAIEAAEQSERLCVPKIFDISPLYDAIDEFINDGWLIAFAYERQEGENATLKRGTNGLLIGPEGGFSKKEGDLLKSKMPILNLGETILRAETAALVALDRIRSTYV